MSDEQKERIEELEELLDESKESLSDLQNEVEQLSSELSCSFSQDELYEKKESFMNEAYNAGYDAGYAKEYKMKSWLNYKIEAGI